MCIFKNCAKILKIGGMCKKKGRFNGLLMIFFVIICELGKKAIPLQSFFKHNVIYFSCDGELGNFIINKLNLE